MTHNIDKTQLNKQRKYRKTMWPIQEFLSMWLTIYEMYVECNRASTFAFFCLITSKEMKFEIWKGKVVPICSIRL